MREISVERFNSALQSSSEQQSEYDDIIRQASETYDVDADLIKSIISVESSGDKNAVSKKGAGGLMQIMPQTAESIGVVDVNDPEQNIMGGTKYYKQMLDKFGGDEELALAAYNAGPDNVTKYNGIPPFEETQNYVSKIKEKREKNSTGSLKEISQERAKGLIVTGQDEKLSAPAELYKKARPYIEAGAIGLSTSLGGLGGMASPVPGGMAIGGALGYGFAEDYMDYLDKSFGIKAGGSITDEAWEAIYNVAEGAAFESLGPVLGKALGGTKQGLAKAAEKTGAFKVLKLVKELFPALSDKGRLLKAKEILQNLRRETPETKKTAEETEKLFKESGIKEPPTHAQKTGSIEEAAFEQTKASQEPDIMAQFKAKDARISEQGIENIKNRFPEGGTVDSVKSVVGKQQQQLTTEAEKAIQEPENRLVGMRAGAKEREAIGEDIYTTVKKAKEGAKLIHEEKYAKIPNEIEVSNAPLKDNFEKTVVKIKESDTPDASVPTAIISKIRKALKSEETVTPTGILDASGKPIMSKVEEKTTVTFAELRKWQKEIGKDIRANNSGANPDLTKVHWLQEIRKGVDDTIDQMAGLEGSQAQIAADYKEAKQAFIKYHDIYRKGSINKILQPGQETTGLKILKSDMPYQFFKPKKAELANSLINAVGKDNAKELIKPYAETLFLTSSTKNGVLDQKVAQKWLSEHKTVLQKYDLYKQFEEVVKLGNLSEQAVSRLKNYQTTTVSTILQTDANKLMKKLFSGRGKTESEKAATELLDIYGIKDNNVAIAGVQNSFKDFLLKEMENSGIDVLKNPIRSIAKSKKLLDTYMPAMKVLYKDSPEKIKAFTDYHKIMEVIARNKNVTYTGGSTTVEKAFAGKTKGAKKETWSKMMESAATLVAIRQGSGWIWSATRNFIKAVTSAPWKISKEEIDQILSEALLNPEAAEALMQVTKNVSKEGIERQLKYHITAGKTIATKEAIEELKGKELNLKDIDYNLETDSGKKAK